MRPGKIGLVLTRVSQCSLMGIPRVTTRVGHPSPAEQASLIRHHIIWWNWNPHDQALRELIVRTNAPDTAIGASHQDYPAGEVVAGVVERRVV